MIGISVPARLEWEAVLNRFNLTHDDCKQYPIGEYFITNVYGKEVLFYRCGVRKMNCSAATQYMIDHFDLKKIIVIGTCAGVDEKYNRLDVIIPNEFVQYDCTVKETETFIKDSFTVRLDLSNYPDINTGIIGTADKPVVMWKDHLELQEHGITVADTESAAIIYICKANNVECVVLRGISDFALNPEESLQKAIDEQYDEFVKNIPIIINKIIDNYLEFALNNTFNYKVGE